MEYIIVHLIIPIFIIISSIIILFGLMGGILIYVFYKLFQCIDQIK